MTTITKVTVFKEAAPETTENKQNHRQGIWGTDGMAKRGRIGPKNSVGVEEVGSS